MFDPATEVDDPERQPAFFEDPPMPERSPAEIERLVRSGLRLVEPMANRVSRELGGTPDIDELASLGRIALFEAAKTFDPERSSFEAYVCTKVRWAMLDGVRRLWGRRAQRARANALYAAEQVLAASLDGAPDPNLPESAHARRFAQLMAAQAAAMAVGLCTSKPPYEEEEAARLDDEEDLDPEDALARARCLLVMRAAVARLPEKQRAIVQRHYLEEEERFDRIAESLGISKSWASRLHAQAMETLAAVLDEHR